MQYLAAVANNFTITWDVGIVAFLAFAGFFYGFSVGARKLGTLLVSAYIAQVLLPMTPYIDKYIASMAEHRAVGIEIGLFALVALALFALLSGSILSSSLALPKKEGGRWWHSIALGTVCAGFLFSSALAIMPEIYYDKLSTITREGFVNNDAHFWWALAGVFALVAVRRTKKKT